ncbi:PA2169 family four-helix-bundle protein [Cognatitamlana onchidii]|uniref:PA2169 family four-helix-bundle protein n=1 Tax=Cognatitamlana onchidii TaxID=2562860 RepID=UPI0010A665F2|nr:PA2169 family four-helix-bundle protein [Algibacter onchidii]
MKRIEHITSKMNDLLIMNAEVEKMYLELFNKLNDYELKTLIKERAEQRNEFNKDLKFEIIELGGKPKYAKAAKSEFYKFWMNFRNLLLLEDNKDLFYELYDLKELSVKKYNDILQEMHLPLSSCKLLIRQRDNIQDAMDALKREEHLVVV